MVSAHNEVWARRRGVKECCITHDKRVRRAARHGKKGWKTIMKGKIFREKILFPFRAVAHVNDVQEAPNSRLERGFRFHEVREWEGNIRKIYVEIIYGHMHDLTHTPSRVGGRGIFCVLNWKLSIFLSTVKIALDEACRLLSLSTPFFDSNISSIADR